MFEPIDDFHLVKSLVIINVVYDEGTSIWANIYNIDTWYCEPTATGTSHDEIN